MVTPTNRPTDRPADRANIEQSAFSKVRKLKKKSRDLQCINRCRRILSTTIISLFATHLMSHAQYTSSPQKNISIILFSFPPQKKYSPSIV